MATLLTLRTSARRKLPRLYHEAQGECFWCKRQTVLLRTLAEQPRTLPLDAATVDHVIPLEYGGDSRVDNLVLSCYTCNNGRSRKEPQKHTHCKGCGRPTGRRSKCKTCRGK